MSEMHEHLEHAEHAQHQAHDPYDRRVALTIAIIAAMLATVTLLSHRAHNDTLQLQIRAGVLKTEESDQWAFYQAKNIRTHEYQALGELLAVSPKAPGKESEAENLQAKWRKQAKVYREKDLPEIKGIAEGKKAEAEELAAQSHTVHATALRYDLGELAVELGLVLCSIAVLTKRRAFWLSGVISASVGILVAASVLYYPPEAHHAHAETHEPATQPAEGHKSGGH